MWAYSWWLKTLVRSIEPRNHSLLFLTCGCSLAPVCRFRAQIAVNAVSLLSDAWQAYLYWGKGMKGGASSCCPRVSDRAGSVFAALCLGSALRRRALCLAGRTGHQREARVRGRGAQLSAAWQRSER